MSNGICCLPEDICWYWAALLLDGPLCICCICCPGGKLVVRGPIIEYCCCCCGIDGWLDIIIGCCCWGPAPIRRGGRGRFCCIMPGGGPAEPWFQLPEKGNCCGIAGCTSCGSEARRKGVWAPKWTRGTEETERVTPQNNLTNFVTVATTFEL